MPGMPHCKGYPCTASDTYRDILLFNLSTFVGISSCNEAFKDFLCFSSHFPSTIKSCMMQVDGLGIARLARIAPRLVEQYEESTSGCHSVSTAHLIPASFLAGHWYYAWAARVHCILAPGHLASAQALLATRRLPAQASEAGTGR